MNARWAYALRLVRLAREMPQEAFEPVSSRTYISQLERGQKSPTLEKIEQLARKMHVHPLTLLTLAYSKSASSDDLKKVFESVALEIAEIRTQSVPGRSRMRRSSAAREPSGKPRKS